MPWVSHPPTRPFFRHSFSPPSASETLGKFRVTDFKLAWTVPTTVSSPIWSGSGGERVQSSSRWCFTTIGARVELDPPGRPPLRLPNRRYVDPPGIQPKTPSQKVQSQNCSTCIPAPSMPFPTLRTRRPDLPFHTAISQVTLEMVEHKATWSPVLRPHACIAGSKAGPTIAASCAIPHRKTRILGPVPCAFDIQNLIRNLVEMASNILQPI